jgi:hypothetical protein
MSLTESQTEACATKSVVVLVVPHSGSKRGQRQQRALHSRRADIAHPSRDEAVIGKVFHFSNIDTGNEFGQQGSGYADSAPIASESRLLHRAVF